MWKSRKSATALNLRRSQTLLKAPDITTAKGRAATSDLERHIQNTKNPVSANAITIKT